MNIAGYPQRSQGGQGTVEYALVTLAIVAIIVVALFSGNGFSKAIQTAFDNGVTEIDTVSQGVGAHPLRKGK